MYVFCLLPLQELQTSLQQQQPKIDTMKNKMMELKDQVERNRPGVGRHPDVEAMEREVTGLNSRWENICIQVVER